MTREERIALLKDALRRRMEYVNHFNKDEKDSKDDAEKVELEKPEDKPQFIVEAEYEQYVEEHILPEPEQLIETPEDALEAAQAGVEEFESVLGKLPESDPMPRPEADAEYVGEEKEHHLPGDLDAPCPVQVERAKRSEKKTTTKRGRKSKK